jgi:hypothetical protein
VPGTADRAEAAELRAENARLREAVERLGLLNEDKDAVIAGLRAQLAEQAEQIARLERLISRNSGNSSMPPSGDDQPGRKPPQPRQRQGGKKRRPGKQPGAAGAYLPWSDHPDGAISHFPEGTCGCGRDLAGARDLGVRYSHQVTDLPGARAETIQHDRHEVECACGRSHIAGPPPEAAGAPGTVTYGLNFQAWCVFLMVMHHVPVERCADILGSMSGTRPSDGWVHALLARAATAVAAANKTIRALIILARVVCGDETPIRSGPGPKTKKRYLQVACTSLLTYYFLGDRDLPSFKDFVYSDLHGTVIVHDRYVNYDHFTGVSHQLCTAHLLRDVEDAAQSYPDAIWPGQIAEALRGLIHAANLARGQGLAAVPGEMTAEHLTSFRRGVTVGLSQVRRVPGAKTKQPPARLLLECLRHREADVLRFLSDTAIPPTSNQAERDLRPSKTQQKISGRLRSEKTTRDRYAIRGYASTAAKHGIAVFTAIRDALAGNPWMPPATEAA